MHVRWLRLTGSVKDHRLLEMRLWPVHVRNWCDPETSLLRQLQTQRVGVIAPHPLSHWRQGLWTHAPTIKVCQTAAAALSKVERRVNLENCARTGQDALQRANVLPSRSSLKLGVGSPLHVVTLHTSSMMRSWNLPRKLCPFASLRGASRETQSARAHSTAGAMVKPFSQSESPLRHSTRSRPQARPPESCTSGA